MNRTALTLPFALALLTLAACPGERAEQGTPVDLDRSHRCAADGMILVDYPGPKAQLIRRDGEHLFFCEVREAFTHWLDPVERNRTTRFLVQDFGGVEWGSHRDRWIDAGNALFVLESRQFGAMGPSFVPFSDRALADAFVREHGGRIATRDEINPQMIEESLIRSYQPAPGPATD